MHSNITQADERLLCITIVILILMHLVMHVVLSAAIAYSRKYIIIIIMWMTKYIIMMFTVAKGIISYRGHNTK